MIMIGIFLCVSIALATIPSEDLILFVGGENVFLLMFVLGMVGGLTTFTGIPYHLILMNFAVGGINPILLGIATAMGVAIGDSTMFFMSKNIKSALPKRISDLIQSLSYFLNLHPKLITPFLILYGSISPFSNDFIVGSLGILGYGYWRIIVPLTIGNIIFNIGIAYAGLYAFDTISGFFG